MKKYNEFILENVNWDDKLIHSVKGTFNHGIVDMNGIKDALDNGAYINCKDDMGITPLMFASASSPEAVKYLIDHGAKLNITFHNSNALMWAIQAPNGLECARVLIDAGIELDCKDDKYGYPLAWCLFLRKNEIAKLLVKAGADLFTKERDAFGNYKCPFDSAFMLNPNKGADQNDYVNEEMRDFIIEYVLENYPEKAKYVIHRATDEHKQKYPWLFAANDHDLLGLKQKVKA